ncbi:MAG: 8-oxo-dGTP diphosphatase [Acidobacteriota bacterium]|jgi:8-oxo-dGTP diphosphatase|nr:8-oxo-dGTP diphosphatase [Acidobacteriota bacterium]
MPKKDEFTRVVAAVIERGGCLLLCLRPAGKRHAGLWEFPGGKLLPGESIPDAARRELAEELAVEVLSVGERLFELPDPGSPFVVEFYPVEIAGEPVALEHEALMWVRPENLSGLDLAPSDRAFASRYASGP